MSRHGEQELYQRIGYRIFKQRTLRRMTARVLAKRAGVHRNTVYRIESGLGISVDVLCKLSAAMGIKVDVLVADAPDVVH